MALVALAAPFIPFVGLDKALYYAGFIVSPAMMALALWALLWGSARILNRPGQVILVLVFAFQPNAHFFFTAARPDHHAMILLCFAAVLAFLARYVHHPDGENRTVAWAGVIAALGVWVSVESLTIELFALLALGALWIFTGQDHWLSALRRFTLAGALTLALALMVERPPVAWLTSEEYDRLSTLHTVLFALIALGVVAMVRSRSRLGTSAGARLAGAVLAAAAAAAVMAALYPAFFKGPFGAAMDPRLNTMWLDQISEFQPMFGTPQDTWVEVLFLFVPLGWALVWGVVTWLKPPHAPFHNRPLVVVLLLGLALFAPLSMMQARWGGYMGVALALPWTLLLVRVLDWPTRPLLRGPVFIAVAVGHMVLSYGYVMATQDPDEIAQNIPPTCPWREITPYLNSTAFAPEGPVTLLNTVHSGSELLYRTPHRVIGTPYHRNTRGILDTYTVLSGDNLSESRAILRARQVDFLVLCVDSSEERLMMRFNADSLMRRIVEDRAPAWLVKEPLPGDLAARFRVLRFTDARP